MGGEGHPEDQPVALEKVNDAINKATKNLENESRFRHKDWSYRWILSHASVIQDEGGKTTRMVGTHVDITQ